ncbi:glycerol-3-phosphate acyltransferase [Synechococcus sp. PCC 7336]|uniref:glycerol-3-phosphate acyltransferase n=1 Tax=Synechococcus sp. PCC 7336 TaxID=195250 RepID=UPI000368A37D|nr:glycerol-3-phosphate acyltransferase [Synechococcus sp. PCC 7336]
MTFSPVWAALMLCTVCPLLGGLPAIAWIVRGLGGKQLSDLGTGNISVSAAFYHGGTGLGLLAVLSEAVKGIGAVLLARFLLPDLPAWEAIALIALVLGRYVATRGAGTTNVVWGYIVHDWIAALLIFGVAGISFGFVRRRHLVRWGVLGLLPVVEALRHPQSPARVAAVIGLSLAIAWIYRQIPDDLALSPVRGNSSSRKMFRYLRGRDVIGSLDNRPSVERMGQKAATLAQLKQWGYPIPSGWILPSGASAGSLLSHMQAAEDSPWSHTWVVRSSALGEDRIDASAAGQYRSVSNVANPTDLEQAILQCRASYHRAGATQYRRDRKLSDRGGMALLVQRQVQGVYAGVAFSRDPIGQGDGVLVEALAGGAEQVVSGRVTPEQYRIEVQDRALEELSPIEVTEVEPDLKLDGSVPLSLVQRVADLARHLELRYHGIPQDIEWSFDGRKLWLLQARPITTLTPIWTRKIAAEVIPGAIRPLTWSLNRPLTCGVWGKIFTIVLGQRTQGLDFGETATLHYSQAYFNATLLGQIFRRMGLPAESLEFLTRGAKFGKPPLSSTLRNLPGLGRLLGREWSLMQDFERDNAQQFDPISTQLKRRSPAQLSSLELLERIEVLLAQLERATYYSILAPLSFALRQTLLKVPDTVLDQNQLPEVASLRAIQNLAQSARQRWPHLAALSVEDEDPSEPSALFDAIGQDPDGQKLLAELDRIVDRYGYLSEVGTDIAVPTWREDPQPVQALFTQFFLHPPQAGSPASTSASTSSPVPSDTDRQRSGWRRNLVQQRLSLKGRVATVYLKLLAELRWSSVALEALAIERGLLSQPGDLFFLTYEELRRWMTEPAQASAQEMQCLVTERRAQFERDRAKTSIPFIIYGNNPPSDFIPSVNPSRGSGIWQGIGASVGQVQGQVKVFRTLQTATPIPPNTIVVVPYTDAGWAPILARAAGLVAEVGGRLSHGAIVAREYNIPAVMDIAHATQLFEDGQTIRIDGRTGTVELLE